MVGVVSGRMPRTPVSTPFACAVRLIRGLAVDIASHVMRFRLTQDTRVYNAIDDATGDVWQALLGGVLRVEPAICRRVGGAGGDGVCLDGHGGCDSGGSEGANDLVVAVRSRSGGGGGIGGRGGGGGGGSGGGWSGRQCQCRLGGYRKYRKHREGRSRVRAEHGVALLGRVRHICILNLNPKP